MPYVRITRLPWRLLVLGHRCHHAIFGAVTLAVGAAQRSRLLMLAGAALIYDDLPDRHDWVGDLIHRVAS